MDNCISIGSQQVGPGMPVFIIAEAGVNHNGDPELAKRLVDAAAEAGADAVKFQTYKTENVVSKTAPKAKYQEKTTDATESQYDMLKKLELAVQDFVELKDYCIRRNILFMSTPHDQESIDTLNELGVKVFKVGSGDITNIPYLKHMACKGKPIILSTGMSYLSEVDEAVRVIQLAGNEQLILLHCVSNYPADPSDVNLRAMETMKKAFGVPIGYSDHTLGIEIPVAAVAMGACVIEKHFTLDRSMPGPDHRASLEPVELKAMVQGIRTVEKALGDGRKQPAASEANTAEVARKSLVAACDIDKGTILSEEWIAVKRPGTGLAPSLLKYIVGRKARQSIPAGTLLTLEMVE